MNSFDRDSEGACIDSSQPLDTSDLAINEILTVYEREAQRPLLYWNSAKAAINSLLDELELEAPGPQNQNPNELKRRAFFAIARSEFKYLHLMFDGAITPH